MRRVFSISLRWHPDMPGVYAIDTVMNAMSDDWIRFSGTQWFCWSDASAQELANAVRQVLRPQDDIIVTALEPRAAQGAAAPWVWKWMNDHMQKQMDSQFRGDDQ